jgi:hypothetical protein
MVWCDDRDRSRLRSRRSRQKSSCPGRPRIPDRPARRRPRALDPSDGTPTVTYRATESEVERGPLDQTRPGIMTSLSPAAIDEVTTLAQRLEEVMHELRDGANEDQVGGLIAHATEVVDRLRELLPDREPR